MGGKTAVGTFRLNAYKLQLKEKNWDHEEQLLLTRPLVRRPETPEQRQDSLDPATDLRRIQLQKRVQRLGFSQAQLDECLAYNEPKLLLSFT